MVATLALVNGCLLGAIATLLIAPLPPVENFAAPPPRKIVPTASPAGPEDGTADIDIGREMFGPNSAKTEPAPVVPRAAGSPMADTPAFKLLGVFLAEGVARPTAIVLIRRGSPPMVTRLTLGGVVDGWTLVAATRDSARLVKTDGTEQTIRF